MYHYTMRIISQGGISTLAFKSSYDMSKMSQEKRDEFTKEMAKQFIQKRADAPAFVYIRNNPASQFAIDIQQHATEASARAMVAKTKTN